MMHIHNPTELGFSAERLERITSAMQHYVAEDKLAGIVSLVARRDKIVHFEAVGMADIAADAPMRRDTIFRIYSMTKPITSTAVLMLMEEGRLRVTDPVAQYIPAFQESKVLAGTPDSPAELVDPVRPMTIHDLLTHTAGLGYGFDDYFAIDGLYRDLWDRLDTDPDFTLADWINELAQIPLLSHPGQRYRYSMATDVLGYLVEVVAQMPFADYLQEHIFAPLGMVDTAFHVAPAKLNRFAANYGPIDGGGLKVIDAPASSRFARPTQHPSGGGGLTSTTSDYLRFAQMLLNEGELDGVRLLGRKTVEWMRANHLPQGRSLPNDPARGFGLGVGMIIDLGQSPTLNSLGNYGWGGAANTNFWVDPQEQIVGILMLQYMPSNTYPVIADYRNLVYQALVG